MARHAFGNYGEMLKEVAYNSIMGEYLTHKANKAQAYSGTFPDENFAREIMQVRLLPSDWMHTYFCVCAHC